MVDSIRSLKFIRTLPCLIGAQNEPGKIAVNRADSLAMCQGFNREWELQDGARSGLTK